MTLEVGRSVFTEHRLKILHQTGLLTITDLTNAGKRGKKVRELLVSARGLTMDDLFAQIAQRVAQSASEMTYDEVKAYLARVRQEYGPLFEVSEKERRGVDVEPMATTISLSKQFPDGTILRIKASPFKFYVNSSVVIGGRDGKGGHRQDTLYSARRKSDGERFYAWLNENLPRAADMTLDELVEVWRQLGVEYDYH
jgi:hypothetical protein